MTTVALAERVGGEERRIEVPAALVEMALKARRTYEAAMRELVAAAQGQRQPGYDGALPEITTALRPNDNPQLSPPRNIREHPLDLMYAKRQIGFSQWSAGDQLRADLELAHLSPMQGVDYEGLYASSVARNLERVARPVGVFRVVRGPGGRWSRWASSGPVVHPRSGPGWSRTAGPPGI